MKLPRVKTAMLNWNSGILPGKMGPRIIDCPKHNLGAASTIALKLRHVVLSLFRFLFKKFHCHYRVRFISRPRLSWYKLTFIFCLYTLWYSVGSFSITWFLSQVSKRVYVLVLYTIVPQEHFEVASPSWHHRDSLGIEHGTGTFRLKDPCPTHCATVLICNAEIKKAFG